MGDVHIALGALALDRTRCYGKTLFAHSLAADHALVGRTLLTGGAGSMFGSLAGVRLFFAI